MIGATLVRGRAKRVAAMNWRSHAQANVALVCAIFATLLGDVVSAQQGRTQSVRVFVTSGDGRTDFVDPDAKASAEDVKKAFQGRKDIVVAESEESSDLVIRVLRIFRHQSGRSAAVTTSPTTAVTSPVLERVVVATMSAGTYTQEVNGAHARSWGAASGRLADQIEKWIRENRTRILERNK